MMGIYWSRPPGRTAIHGHAGMKKARGHTSIPQAPISSAFLCCQALVALGRTRPYAYSRAGLLACGSSRYRRPSRCQWHIACPFPDHSDEFARDFHPLPFSPGAMRPTPAVVFNFRLILYHKCVTFASPLNYFFCVAADCRRWGVSARQRLRPASGLLVGADQKHRCGGEVDLLLSRPYPLPHAVIGLHGHAQGRQGVHVPLRPVDPRQRHAAGDFLHAVEVVAHVQVLHPGAYAVGAVPLIGVTGLVVKQVAVPVGVEVHQQPAGLQHPAPFAVGPLRLGQVPGDVSGHHHVEAAVGEIQRLGVHLDKFDAPGQRAGIDPGLRQHGGRQVDGGHAIARLRQQYGKEAGAGAHLQDVNVARFASRKAGGDALRHGLPPQPALACGQLLPVHVGIARGPLGPVFAVFADDRRVHVVLAEIGFILYYRIQKTSRNPHGGIIAGGFTCF